MNLILLSLCVDTWHWSECKEAWSLGENKHSEIWFVKKETWRKDGLNKEKIKQSEYFCAVFLSESQNLGSPWSFERPQRQKAWERPQRSIYKYTWRTSSVLIAARCLLCVCINLYFALGRKLLCDLLGLGHTQIVGCWKTHRGNVCFCSSLYLKQSCRANLQTISDRIRQTHHSCNWLHEG